MTTFGTTHDDHRRRQTGGPRLRGGWPVDKVFENTHRLTVTETVSEIDIVYFRMLITVAGHSAVADFRARAC